MNKKGNTAKIVIIVLLILMILGCIGIILFDKINIKKEDTKTEEKLVKLDINGKEIKEMISSIQFDEWSDSIHPSPYACAKNELSYKLAEGKILEGNISNDEIIYFASLFVNTKVCENDKTSECKKIYDSFRNDRNVIDEETGEFDEYVYFEYFEIEDLKKKVREIFGPDIENSIKDEDYIELEYNSNFPDNWRLSSDETKYYMYGFNVNPDCTQSTIQLDEANQKDDEIYTYWKIGDFSFSFSCVDFDSIDYEDALFSYYTTYFKEGDIIKKHDYKYDACAYDDVSKLFDELRSIGKATRYKITYKKQSDGKYYIYSGEWE
ncbi:MAG: hypothetical protein NC181_05325 [Clostridium sp.]|nr:hypothetical protein [Clostridium sp.]